MDIQSVATGSGATVAIVGVIYAFIRCFHHRKSKCMSCCITIDVSSDDTPPREIAVPSVPEGTITKK
jgi:hypothetical protein